jgi:GTP-binding protein
VFTKADKIKEKETETKINNYLGVLKADWESLPHHFVTSSEKRLGREPLLNYIQQINQKIEKH